MKPDRLFWLGLALLAVSSSAQMIVDPNWHESDVPPPPTFNKNQLIQVEMPKYVSLQLGVDPATLVITADGVVRYVMVASNASGSITAMYEGIRCATGEVKTYARYASNGQWTPQKDPQWQSLSDNLRSRHALALARQGACQNRSVTGSSVAAIVKALQSRSQNQYP